MVNKNWENNSKLIMPKDFMQLFPESPSRHLKLAREVLIKTNALLLKNKFTVLRSDTNYHIVCHIPAVGLFSIYCGGFVSRIDLQKLKYDGTVNNRYEEKGFKTPEDVIDELIKYRNDRKEK